MTPREAERKLTMFDARPGPGPLGELDYVDVGMPCPHGRTGRCGLCLRGGTELWPGWVVALAAGAGFILGTTVGAFVTAYRCGFGIPCP